VSWCRRSTGYQILQGSGGDARAAACRQVQAITVEMFTMYTPVSASQGCSGGATRGRACGRTSPSVAARRTHDALLCSSASVRLGFLRALAALKARFRRLGAAIARGDTSAPREASPERERARQTACA